MTEFRAPEGMHIRFSDQDQEYHLVDNESHEVLVANEDYEDFLDEVRRDYCVTFLIYNNNMGLFFSNEDGWVDPDSATRFTEEERLSIPHLPGVGSEWVESDSPAVTAWEDPDA